MAVLLRTAQSPSLSKWLSVAGTCHASWFSTYQHLTTTTTTTTKVTAPYTQDLLTNVQQRYLSQHFIQRRNFYSYFRKKKSIEQIKDDDKVEPHYELVYSANSVSYVQLGYGGVQIAVGIACLTSVISLCVTPLTVITVLQEQAMEVAVFLTFNLMICLGILRISTWYPFRIYYSEMEDQFVAVFVGTHPLAIRNVKILPGEVKPSPPGRVAAVIVPWSHHLYSTSTQKIHLNVEHFKYPVYYNKMLGYVKESY